MTTTEMAQKLSVNRRTVQRELEKLKKKNYIELKVAGVMDIGKFIINRIPYTKTILNLHHFYTISLKKYAKL